MMHGHGKSDSAIVAGKPTNKAAQPPRVERTRLCEGGMSVEQEENRQGSEQRGHQDSEKGRLQVSASTRRAWPPSLRQQLHQIAYNSLVVADVEAIHGRKCPHTSSCPRSALLVPVSPSGLFSSEREYPLGDRSSTLGLTAARFSMIAIS